MLKATWGLITRWTEGFLKILLNDKSWGSSVQAFIHIFFCFWKNTTFCHSFKRDTTFFRLHIFFSFHLFSFEKTQLLFTQIIFFIRLVVCPDVHPVVHPVICPVIRPVIRPVIHPVIRPVVRPVVHPVVHPVIRPLPCHPPGYSSGYLMFPNLTNHFIKLSNGDFNANEIWTFFQSIWYWVSNLLHLFLNIS